VPHVKRGRIGVIDNLQVHKMRNERRDKSREIILEWSLKFNKSFIDALGTVR
jgi:hypothetical protein